MAKSWDEASSKLHIHYYAAVTAEERALIERWAATNAAADIDAIAIHDRLVSVHSDTAQLAIAAGTALRGDDLTGELSAALAKMRNLFKP